MVQNRTWSVDYLKNTSLFTVVVAEIRTEMIDYLKNGRVFSSLMVVQNRTWIIDYLKHARRMPTHTVQIRSFEFHTFVTVTRHVASNLWMNARSWTRSIRQMCSFAGLSYSVHVTILKCTYSLHSNYLSIQHQIPSVGGVIHRVVKSSYREPNIKEPLFAESSIK